MRKILSMWKEQLSRTWQIRMQCCWKILSKWKMWNIVLSPIWMVWITVDGCFSSGEVEAVSMCTPQTGNKTSRCIQLHSGCPIPFTETVPSAWACSTEEDGEGKLVDYNRLFNLQNTVISIFKATYHQQYPESNMVVSQCYFWSRKF